MIFSIFLLYCFLLYTFWEITAGASNEENLKIGIFLFIHQIAFDHSRRWDSVSLKLTLDKLLLILLNRCNNIQIIFKAKQEHF